MKTSELSYGSLADYFKLGIFCCPIYAHVKEDELGPRARKFIVLGYVSRVKGYQLWCVDPKSPKLKK